MYDLFLVFFYKTNSVYLIILITINNTLLKDVIPKKCFVLPCYVLTIVKTS